MQKIREQLNEKRRKKHEEEVQKGKIKEPTLSNLHVPGDKYMHGKSLTEGQSKNAYLNGYQEIIYEVKLYTVMKRDQGSHQSLKKKLRGL